MHSIFAENQTKQIMVKKQILLLLLSAIISLPLAAEEEIRLTMKVGNETGGARTGFKGYSLF